MAVLATESRPAGLAGRWEWTASSFRSATWICGLSKQLAVVPFATMGKLGSNQVLGSVLWFCPIKSGTPRFGGWHSSPLRDGLDVPSLVWALKSVT